MNIQLDAVNELAGSKGASPITINTLSKFIFSQVSLFLFLLKS